MNDFLEKHVFTRRKKNLSLARVSERKDKMLPLAKVDCCLRKWKELLPRKSVTLLKIWYFLKNWLSLISVTVSTRRKNL